MSEEDKAEARRVALDVIRAYRDGGCVLPPPPSPDLVREMMSWLVCEDVPDEYVPMMLEEMELDGSDPRARRRRGRRARPAPSSRSSSSGAGSRVCSPASGCRRPASRTRSSRRTPTSAARGSRTRTRVVASTSGTTSTATRSSRAITGPSTSPSSRRSRRTSPRSWPATASSRTSAGTPKSCRPSGTMPRAPGRSSCAPPTASRRRSPRAR